MHRFQRSIYKRGTSASLLFAKAERVRASHQLSQGQLAINIATLCSTFLNRTQHLESFGIGLTGVLYALPFCSTHSTPAT